MTRFLSRTILLGAAAAVLAAPAVSQSASPLAQAQAHLKAVDTMTASFSQTGRNGRVLNGTLTLKRPGKIRFEYGKGIPMLIVGDGKALTFIDYEVRQVSRWPIGNSPLSVLLNPNEDLSNVARVTRDDRQVLLVQARDASKPEFGTITIAFAKVPSAPQGLMLQGWTTIDAQNNRSTIRLTNQRFNVAVADSAFRWTDPRRQAGRS